jgi:hypothetical protein
MKTSNRPLRLALFAALMTCTATVASAGSARDEILDELRSNCAASVEEILMRDFQVKWGEGIDRGKFCACADEQFQRDPWLDRIASMPPTERQRPSKAWIYLDRAYFLAGLECLPPLPDSDKPRRSMGEVKAALDQHKTLLYGAYRQALKSRPDLTGQVQAFITIAPSGKVKTVRITPQDFGGVEFIRNLETVLRAVDFGMKDVPEQTIRFPMDFSPQ